MRLSWFRVEERVTGGVLMGSRVTWQMGMGGEGGGGGGGGGGGDDGNTIQLTQTELEAVQRLEVRAR